MTKKLCQLMTLSLLLISMSDYVRGEPLTHEKVFTSCITEGSFGRKKVKCTALCNATYKTPVSGFVDEKKDANLCPHPEKPYSCLCTYVSPDE